MAMNILQGGIIRWPLPVKPGTPGADSFATWDRGQIVEVETSSSQVVRGTGATNRVSGLACEQRSAGLTPGTGGSVGTSQGQGFTQDQTGASGFVSILLSEAVVESNVIQSGLTFAVNDLVYSTSDGKLTNSSSNNKKYGQIMPTGGPGIGRPGIDSTPSGFVRLHYSIQL